MNIQYLLCSLIVTATLASLPAAARDTDGKGPWVGRQGSVTNVKTGQIVETGYSDKQNDKVAKALNKAEAQNDKGVIATPDGQGDLVKPGQP
jgi:hypothetical protein